MGLAAWRQYLLPQAPMTIEEPLVLKILTVNTHKGFTVFNRRFILHELREAIRATHADIVFLQEVLGAHHRHAQTLARRSEEHTSELPSLMRISYAVFCLKKKKNNKRNK